MSYRDKDVIFYLDTLPDNGIELGEVIKISTNDYVVTKLNYFMQIEIRLEKLRTIKEDDG